MNINFEGSRPNQPIDIGAISELVSKKNKYIKLDTNSNKLIATDDRSGKLSSTELSILVKNYVKENSEKNIEELTKLKNGLNALQKREENSMKSLKFKILDFIGGSYAKNLRAAHQTIKSHLDIFNKKFDELNQIKTMSSEIITNPIVNQVVELNVKKELKTNTENIKSVKEDVKNNIDKLSNKLKTQENEINDLKLKLEEYKCIKNIPEESTKLMQQLQLKKYYEKSVKAIEKSIKNEEDKIKNYHKYYYNENISDGSEKLKNDKTYKLETKLYFIKKRLEKIEINENNENNINELIKSINNKYSGNDIKTILNLLTSEKKIDEKIDELEIEIKEKQSEMNKNEIELNMQKIRNKNIIL